jgi:hypothetical protein
MIIAHVTPAQYAWLNDAVQNPDVGQVISAVRGLLCCLALERRVDGNIAFVLRTIGTTLCPEIKIVVD